MNSIRKIFKRVFDIMLSIIMLVLFLPLFILISVAIKVNSRGPVIFKQDRLGQFGCVFRIYKFRSMVVNAENMGTGIYNYKGDNRVTKVGTFLRITSFDELPQLLNILKGEMSFVGPRPPVIYELGNYDDFDDRLKRRFILKPGMTGYSQIRGRNKLSWDEKIEHDLQYINDYYRLGLFLDIKIIFITMVKIITNEGNYELEDNAQSDSEWTNRKK